MSRGRFLRLELLVPFAAGATVVCVALGSSSVREANEIGGTLRWGGLFALAVLSLAWLAVRRPRLRPPLAPFAAGGALVAVALLSVLWSVEPRLSAARAVSFGVLLAAAGAIGLAASDERDVRWVLHGLLGGTAVVAALGVVVLAVDPGAALREGTSHTPFRYQGLGEDPNTVSLLAGIAFPLACWLVVESAGRARWLAATTLLLLGGTIVFSGSRGGVLAAAAGLLVFVLLLIRSPRRRAVLVAAVLAVAAAGVTANELRIPSASLGGTQPASSAAAEPSLSVNFQNVLRLEDEIGHPPLGTVGGPSIRRFLRDSGRWVAWKAAAEQGTQRPILGHGFGTEEKVFIDRYYLFEGQRPENSYLGVWLQLGAVGVTLLAALLGLLVWTACRALPALDGQRRRLAAVALAVVVAGACAAVVQSYVYAVGNIATLTLWVCGALIPVAARWARESRGQAGEEAAGK